MTYNTYKKEKFLENANSFALVTFFADPQKKFVELRGEMFLNNLVIKNINSRAIKSAIGNYINKEILSFLNNAAKGPVFLLQNKNKNDSILDSFLKIDEKVFLKRKMRVLLCFVKGAVYNTNLLFNLNKKKVEQSFFSPFSFLKQRFCFYLEIYQKIIIKMFLIYVKLNKKIFIS